MSLAKARPERNVKGRRREAVEERVYLTPDTAPVVLEKHTAERHLFERIRDEAHRFAIEYHRRVRSRRTVKSELDSIPGLGPKRRTALLRAFGSAAGVRQADKAALRAAGMPGPVADAILEWAAGAAPRAD